MTRDRVWCAGEFVGSRKAFFHDSGRGPEAQKSISAKRSFWVRWIHDFETRKQVFSSVVGSSRIWSTMWSSISGARGDDILFAARARQAEYQRSAVTRFQRRFLQDLSAKGQQRCLDKDETKAATFTERYRKLSTFEKFI